MKITIITATWNSGKTIGDTLESVLNQNYEDIEHIIVDGGSSDDTLEIIKRYEPRYRGRLKWISEPDRGIYDAMNKGIRLATGDVIGILNSDDFFTSRDVLQRVADETHDVDAVYGDIHFVRPDNLAKTVRYYSSKSFRRWKMRLGFMPAHPSFYCRRSVYQRFGLFDTNYKIAADFDQLLRLIYCERITIKYIPMDFVTMRTGGASTSGLKSHRQILKEHMIAYRRNNVRSNYFLESIRYVCKAFGLLKYKLSKY